MRAGNDISSNVILHAAQKGSCRARNHRDPVWKGIEDDICVLLLHYSALAFFASSAGIDHQTPRVDPATHV